MTKFNNLKDLLEDCKIITEPILEEGREFNPDKSSYFIPGDSIEYSHVEWHQIEQTNLGRRLQNYFDQLKADRRMLAVKMNQMVA